MRILLVVFSFVLALIGWFRPRNGTSRSLSMIVVLTLVAVGVVQIVLNNRDALERDKTRNVGRLNSGRLLLSREMGAMPTAKVELGDSGAILNWKGPQGQPLFSALQDNLLTLVMKSGEIKVSTLIRNRTGAVVAEIVENEWKVNAPKAYDRNYAPDALEVIDETGEVVLQVRHLTDRVRFQGKFYTKDGRGFGLGKVRDENGEVIGVIEKTGCAHKELNLKIDRIFRYPSEMHLGEFALVEIARE